MLELSSFLRLTKRSRTDIVKSLLEICKKVPTITTLLYESRLSYSQLRWYIDIMEDNGLVKVSKEGRFGTTVKGDKYLKVVAELDKLVRFDKD